MLRVTTRFVERRPVDDDIPTAEFLLRLLSDEVERRDAKQLDTRLRKANFEHRKSLDDFDFTFNPRVPKTQVIDLATCGFIRKHENVCIVGQAGVGKSHIAQAIGHRACLAGFDVLYTPAHKMLKDLRACRADGTHDRRLARYSSVDLLIIIDDLGLRALTGDEPIGLHDIIRQRYERASTVITSNRGLEEWAPLFNDQLLGNAAMDRLLHHVKVIEVTGASYRNPPSRPKKKAS
ncbi:MAG: IS21-like element helper ATPase IstB [Nannocystales bacterium]